MTDAEHIETLRKVVRGIAQMVHQAYHMEQPGTFRECPKNVCVAARNVLDDVGEPKTPEHGTHLCPFHGINPNEDHSDRCTREQCMLWNAYHQACSLWAISSNLTDIAQTLEQMLNGVLEPKEPDEPGGAS